MRIVFALIVLVVLLIYFGRPQEAPPSTTATTPSAPALLGPLTPREKTEGKITLKDFKPSVDYNVLTSDFTVQNASDYDIKDIEIRCDHYAASGTRIDSNTRTIYEIFPARSTRTVARFNMGLVHNQLKRTGCDIRNYQVGAHRPPPAAKAQEQPKAPAKPLDITTAR